MSNQWPCPIADDQEQRRERMAQSILYPPTPFEREDLARRHPRVDQIEGGQAQAARRRSGFRRRGPATSERQDSEKSHERLGQERCRRTQEVWTHFDESENLTKDFRLEAPGGYLYFALDTA